MSICYAELGSLYPGDSGAYTIVRRVLGEPLGFVALLLFMVLGVVILLIGVVIAMFDTGLSGNLAYARIYRPGRTVGLSLSTAFL